MVVLNSRFILKSKDIIRSLLSPSKDAVGSSHKISWGFMITALAKTTRDFSPPEHSSGFFFNIGPIPIISMILSKSCGFRFAADFAYSKGNLIFSSTVKEFINADS